MNIAVIGASGAIAQAFIEQLASNKQHKVYAFSSRELHFNQENIVSHTIQYDHEQSIEKAAFQTKITGMLDRVIITTGLLHSSSIQPEKTFKSLCASKMMALFAANTITPSLVTKHFIPYLRKNERSVIAILSARVGSISDNKLGGWYSYRASKAALNMMIKTYSHELARTHKQALIVGLHPGTVESALSEPFQANVPEGKLFTPAFSAKQLWELIEKLSTKDSGHVFAWDSQRIEA